MGNYSSSRGSKTTLNKSLLIRRVASSHLLCASFSSRSRSSLVFTRTIGFHLITYLAVGAVRWRVLPACCASFSEGSSWCAALGITTILKASRPFPVMRVRQFAARFSFQPLCKRLITYFLFQLNQATRVDDLVLW